MNKKKLRIGLVGKNVSVTLSDKIHAFILKEKGVDCEYEKMSVPEEEFDFAMRRLFGDFDGFNITIPYKRDVLEYCEEIVGDALSCGAVNTVVCCTGAGYNTDGVGFMIMLSVNGVQVQGKKVLVIGAGGAGRSVAVALKNAGADVFMYRRNKAELAEVCEQLGVIAASDIECGGYDILINCSGVGMHDTVGKSPVSSAAFLGANCAVDLIYNPAETEFLRLARMNGLKTVNGGAMLFYQAYYADCLFLGEEPNEKEAKMFYEKFLTENGSVKI